MKRRNFKYGLDGTLAFVARHKTPVLLALLTILVF